MSENEKRADAPLVEVRGLKLYFQVAAGFMKTAMPLVELSTLSLRRHSKISFMISSWKESSVVSGPNFLKASASSP